MELIGLKQMKVQNGIVLVETVFNGKEEIERLFVYEQEKDAMARINKLLPLFFSEPEKVPLAPKPQNKAESEDYL